ncbi:hypothetical protein CDV31_010941 [Fusarium ambrosium]|uniref:Uncharacterized protein n=1 Tax=Fusarium ambrosium TaxID=131363 RepID=A0A428TKA3_9HYPO|nr:hypothetical protein CDV31_010941 [Fusarium ambrosium]
MLTRSTDVISPLRLFSIKRKTHSFTLTSLGTIQVNRNTTLVFAMTKKTPKIKSGKPAQQQQQQQQQRSSSGTKRRAASSQSTKSAAPSRSPSPPAKKAKPYTAEHANERFNFFKERADERHAEGQRLLLQAKTDYEHAAKLRAEELESGTGAEERDQLWQSTLSAARKAKADKAEEKVEEKADDA